MHRIRVIPISRVSTQYITVSIYPMHQKINIVTLLKLQDRFSVELRLHRFILCTRRSGGTANEGGGAISQLDLPSLTPFSVAGYRQLQLAVPHWATAVDYCM